MKERIPIRTTTEIVQNDRMAKSIDNSQNNIDCYTLVYVCVNKDTKVIKKNTCIEANRQPRDGIHIDST